MPDQEISVFLVLVFFFIDQNQSFFFFGKNQNKKTTSVTYFKNFKESGVFMKEPNTQSPL
jgi:hypothetical protein